MSVLARVAFSPTRVAMEVWMKPQTEGASLPELVTGQCISCMLASSTRPVILSLVETCQTCTVPTHLKSLLFPSVVGGTTVWSSSDDVERKGWHDFGGENYDAHRCHGRRTWQEGLRWEVSQANTTVAVSRTGLRQPTADCS